MPALTPLIRESLVAIRRLPPGTIGPLPHEHDAAVLLARASKQPPDADLVAWACREHAERCAAFVLQIQLRSLYDVIVGVRRAQATGLTIHEPHLARLNAAAAAGDWLPTPNDVLVQVRDIQSRTTLLPLITETCRQSKGDLLAEVLDRATRQDPLAWVLENKVQEACTEALRLAMTFALHTLPKDPGIHLRHLKLWTSRAAEHVNVTLNTLTFGDFSLRIAASVSIHSRDQAAVHDLWNVWKEGFVMVADNVGYRYLLTRRHTPGRSRQRKYELRIEQGIWPRISPEASSLTLSGPPTAHGAISFEIPLR